MSIDKIITNKVNRIINFAQKSLQKAAQQVSETINTPKCLEGLNALGSYNIGLAKQNAAMKNAVKMSYEDFDALLKKRKKLIPYEKRDEIQSIFIGNCFGESSNEIINKYLRTGEAPVNHKYWNKETIEKRVKKIQEVSKKISLDKDYTVYRGVKNLDFLPDAGKTFIEKGFMSTTASERVAECYSQMGPIMEIVLPKGTNVNLNSNDLEVLLNNGSKFKVLSKGKLYAKLLLLNNSI